MGIQMITPLVGIFSLVNDIVDGPMMSVSNIVLEDSNGYAQGMAIALKNLKDDLSDAFKNGGNLVKLHSFDEKHTF